MTHHLPADQAQRDAALDPARSVIVQAPAGSGKTGLLAQRFLGLLARVEQPEEIVAITFTRKAAAEMRERILHAMRQASAGVSGNDDASANDRLTHQLAAAALARDNDAGWGLLANPARLRVMTIDAFNAMLTRQMPVTSEFGQQPGIAEDGMAACRKAARRLLEMADAGDQPGPQLQCLLSHLDNRLADVTELVAMMLARRDLWLRHLDIHGLDRDTLEANLAEEVTSALQATWNALPAGLLPAVQERVEVSARFLQDNEAVTEANAWILQLAEHGRDIRPDAGDLDYWQMLGKFLLTDNGEGTVRKAGGLSINNGFPPPSRAKGEEKAAREQHKAAMGEWLDALRDIPLAVQLLRLVAKLPVPHYTEEQWQVLEAMNGLLKYAVACLQEEFRDSGEVDFAELAIRARSALGSDEQPTDLAMRLDYQVRHLLVDEFQDTSHSQIDLLLRLTRGWEPADGRSLFLVGDPMQSIYAFREAEVGHFLAVRDHGLGPLQLESLRLSANFRSQAGVVNWVNDAFGGASGGKDDIEGIFPAQDRPAVGAIAFEPSEATRPELPGDAVSIHAFGQGEHDAEAARVIELVQQGVNDQDNHGTAILVRGRRHLAAILPALRAAGISFRAVELESLEAQPEIHDLFALTRAIVNPADATALYSVCRAPWCGMSLQELHSLYTGNIPPWRNLLDSDWQAGVPAASRARITRLADVMNAAWQSRGRRSLRERVEGAWLALGGPAVLREAEQLDNAMLFFELLQQLEAAGDLDDVNELEQRLSSLYAAPDPTATDNVQVMTLHKAKGLQFDTVIIPALDQVTGMRDRLLFHWIERPGPHGQDRVLLGPLRSRVDEEGGAIYRFIEHLRDDKAAFELARLLYVGVTRAKRKVHLLGKARFTTVKDVVQLSPPKQGSLLDLLWRLPEVRAAFEAVPLPEAEPETATRSATPLPLQRVEADWQLPDIPPGPALTIRGTGVAAGHDQVVYEWAGDRVRHTGTLVHRILQRIADEGFEQWNAAAIEQLPLAQRLRAMGLPESECEPAAADARAAVQRALQSEKGRWILSVHDDAQTEWALSGMDNGELVSVSIDRSFVDADGTRWIIDYKTSTHEGGQMDEFLANQQARYRDQLERYARLVSRLDDRPVRVALYFPLQDAFHAWEPEQKN
jgi:ATP-dependent exoDNAse (exonuclease V) beta subunit